MLNIFHISDLHFTNVASGQLRDSALAGAKAILELAERLKADGTLGSEVCLAITGDLVQSGEAPTEGSGSDFEGVQTNLLRPLMDILQIGPERVFISPGNHELNRKAIEVSERVEYRGTHHSRICEDDIHGDLRKKLASYFEFISQNGYQSVTLESPRAAFFKVGLQQIVCFNGLAGAYSRQGSGDKGELFILNTELANHLSGVERNAIILTHHPLSWYADNCATDLKGFLAHRQCRVLTGHIHDRGIEWLATESGHFVTVQAGASSEPESPNQVAVVWLPASNSAAVRHYELDIRVGKFGHTAASQTKVMPNDAAGFFQRTAAFYDPSILQKASESAFEAAKRDLATLSGHEIDRYVVPDLAVFPSDQFSSKRTTIEVLETDNGHRMISGEELSGKSSLITFLCARACSPAVGKDPKVGVLIDFRLLRPGGDILPLLLRRLTDLGLERHQAEYLLQIGKVDFYVDNFDAGCGSGSKAIGDILGRFPRARWTLATRGDQTFMPSRAPANLPLDKITYYQLVEVTLPTVMKMIEGHGGQARSVERPRAIVEQVFRSINNLRAPRTVFYVKSLVDIFLNDGSVEPLNRYLLIENLLSDRIRAAHKHHRPSDPIDMEMIDTFIGQIAYRLMERSESYLSKAAYYQLVDEFIERKGIQPKRFQADTILNILIDSFVLREYEPGYGFMMLSVEDYYLAKHMSRDDQFRSQVMSIEGLLTFPTVAEYYVAQNPSDRPRIEAILTLIDSYVAEVSPVIEQYQDLSREAIRAAAPGTVIAVHDRLLERMSEIENAEDATLIRFEDPKPVGRTKRIRFSEDERGAVFLQLGASILGVTRTLDQADRIAIFRRLRPALLTSILALPTLAQVLAEGGEIRFRGVTVKADMVAELSVAEDRYYLILRGMLYGLYKSFATWSGSPSFFRSAKTLRDGEEDEFVRAALMAQNVEADLSEAVDHIVDISDRLESFVLKEVIIQHYLEAMTLVPLEHYDQSRALDALVGATTELKPPKKMKDPRMVEMHKTRLKQFYSDKIGFNAYVGRLVKVRKK